MASFCTNRRRPYTNHLTIIYRNAVITKIDIQNYKSIDKLKLELGRINVFIGENGAGKSNILEVLALGAAASADKLDNEFLASRGIRVTKPELMRSALTAASCNKPISLSIKGEGDESVSYKLENDNKPYSKWSVYRNITTPENLFRTELEKFLNAEIKIEGNDSASEMYTRFEKILDENLEEIEKLAKAKPGNISKGSLDKFVAFVNFAEKLKSLSPKPSSLEDFVIYSPENSALRVFKSDTQIEPLGINGEGLLKLVSIYSNLADSRVLNDVKESLKILDWFADFNVVSDTNEGYLQIQDRFVDEKITDLNHLSANEGFLFLLFYFVLFQSDLTPKFFAIDNIDASLNPKLCRKLIEELVKIAKKNDKQVIFTTHNPVVLDGLNLNDDEQRLFVISRNQNGATRIRRIMKPTQPAGSQPYRLSDLFIRGILGGLPKGF